MTKAQPKWPKRLVDEQRGYGAAWIAASGAQSAFVVQQAEEIRVGTEEQQRLQTLIDDELRPALALLEQQHAERGEALESERRRAEGAIEARAQTEAKLAASEAERERLERRNRRLAQEQTRLRERCH